MISLFASLTARAQSQNVEAGQCNLPQQQQRTLRPPVLSDAEATDILMRLPSLNYLNTLENYVFVIENNQIKILGTKADITKKTWEIFASPTSYEGSAE